MHRKMRLTTRVYPVDDQGRDPVVNTKWPLLLLLLTLCGAGYWWLQSDEPGAGLVQTTDGEDEGAEDPESPDLVGDGESPVERAQQKERERVARAKRDVVRRKRVLTEGTVKERLAVLKEVAALRGDAVAYLDEVIQCAWHEDRQLRDLAGGVLSVIGAPAIAPYVKRLVEQLAAQADQRRPSLRGADPHGVLRRLGPDVYPAIAAAMESPHMAGFCASMFMRARSTQESFSNAVPELREALSSRSVRVQSVAAEALGDCGPVAAVAVPGLVDLLQSDNVGLRRVVIESLGQIGPDAASATQDLERHLEKQGLSGDERRMTQYSLHRIRGQ